MQAALVCLGAKVKFWNWKPRVFVLPQKKFLKYVDCHSYPGIWQNDFVQMSGRVMYSRNEFVMWEVPFHFYRVAFGYIKFHLPVGLPMCCLCLLAGYDNHVFKGCCGKITVICIWLLWGLWRIRCLQMGFPFDSLTLNPF